MTESRAMKMQKKCGNCKYLMKDWSTGYFECMKEPVMTDDEYAEYEATGRVVDCKHYEQDFDAFFGEVSET